jgi:hypothetical protein
VLVKWWLLAIPQYLVVAILTGGDESSWASIGLVGLLVLIAAFALAFTAEYPPGIYDFVMGLDRWVLRVAAYAALMTDQYPPFRLDQGGREPTAVPVAGPRLDTSPAATGRQSTLTKEDE